MTNKTESIAAKIRALLAKTVENGASEAEAMMAMKKASDMMEKYNLSITEVELREESCITHEVDTGRRAQNAMRRVVTAIAAFCDCKVWVTHSRYNNVQYSFFGLERDTQIAQYLYDMIQNSMELETKVFKKSDTYKEAEMYRGGRRRASNSFELGFTGRIAQRLMEMKRERDATQRSTGTNLVVVKNQIVEVAFRDLGLNLGTSYSRTAVNGAAQSQGAAAGSRVNITTGVGANTSNQKRIA